MTILFAFAEDLVNGLVELDKFDLPLGLVSRVRRVLKNLREEKSLYDPEREKILKKFCTLERDGEKQFWKFPLKEDENFPEFEKRWSELQNQKVIFPYEPVNYLDIIDATPDEIKKKIIAKGTDFDVLEALNQTYDMQFNKKEVAAEETPSAGEEIAPESAKPDAK